VGQQYSLDKSTILSHETRVLSPAVALALANTAAEPGAHCGFAERFIAIAFEPEWNLEHRLVIFAAIVGLLFVSGVGLPLPEDIPLTLAGFTTIKQANDHFVLGHFLTTFVIVVIPILLGDLIAYGLGNRYGLGLRERISILRRTLSPPRLARVQAWFDRYGAFAVFLGRQVAGVRFVTFFMAGSMRVPLPKFVGFDFLGCLVSVPVWLTLGALASRYGEAWLHAAMGRASHTILLIAVVLIVVLALVTKLRNRRDRVEAS
jgi:membrane protein DedA with SNARE-associated domain